jgi:thiamine-monophosphate kinase
MSAREFARIGRFSRFFSVARVPVGIGDDCAVLRPRPGWDLCVTTDALVEGVHFTREHFSLADVGHKALAVNLSDLAAMGARPAWFLCALELPAWVDDRRLDGLARGMSALAREHRIALVGGNLSRARSLSVTLTAVGEVPRGGALRRAGGRAGDRLYVSGRLGDARLGLALLAKGLRGQARARQLRPTPRIALGLVARRFASAAIDVSDGLAQDAGHLARASGVRAVLELSALPISRELERHAARAARLWAVSGGEDYELLLAVPPKAASRFERACARAGERVTRIGELVTGRGVAVVDPQRGILPTPPGFDHFEAPARQIDRPSRRK